jgi:outer membrane protein OmpA-like peptidoglycan-associated protein
MLLVFLAACQKPMAPPGPVAPPLPEPAISATVHTLPADEDILFNGEAIGRAPAKLKVHSIEQLTDNLGAANAPNGAIEQRINYVASNEVEVTLIFDRNLSKMANALNLKKILVFDYGDEITFEFNKSELKPVFVSLLAKQSETLKKHFSGINIYICGHSDSIGRPMRNFELSLERAQTVFDALAKSGIPQKSMKVHGFGPDYPLASNDTEAGRARNRRIEIILGR